MPLAWPPPSRTTPFWPLIHAPPLTVTDWLPPPGVPPVGVTEFDVVPGPSPAEFSASTVHVYVVPGSRPVTTTLRSEPSTTSVWPPGLQVMMYDVMVAPPLLVGASHVTSISPGPAVASTFVGAPGAVTAGAGAFGVPEPETAPLQAVTLQATTVTV